MGVPLHHGRAAVLVRAAQVAAYLLDHNRWAKVPTSVLVRARHPIFCYNNRMSSVRASSLDLAAKDAGVCVNVCVCVCMDVCMRARRAWVFACKRARVGVCMCCA